MRLRAAAGLLASTTLLVTAFAAPAGATPVPSTPDAGHQPSKHHFSAAAQSFVGADTVQKRVAKLEAAMSTLPKESTAYNATKLWNQGITGAGSTVTTLVSFGDDQVKQVLDTYSKNHGLPPHERRDPAAVRSGRRRAPTPASTPRPARAGAARPTSTSR